MRGRIAGYDLRTNAPAEAADFYGQVLGWETPAPDGDPIRRVGTLPVSTGSPHGPHWLCHLTVEQLAMALEMVTALGGRLLDGSDADRPVVQGPGGCIFRLVLGDPDASEESAEVQAAVAWNECITEHFDEDWNFVAGLFGWLDRGTMTHPDGRQYRMFGRDHRIGNGLGAFSTRSADLHRPGWVIYFTVDDLTPRLAKVSEGGGTVTSTPMQLPNGDWVVRCRDPHGAVFALHSSSKS